MRHMPRGGKAARGCKALVAGKRLAWGGREGRQECRPSANFTAAATSVVGVRWKTSAQVSGRAAAAPSGVAR